MIISHFFTSQKPAILQGCVYVLDIHCKWGISKSKFFQDIKMLTAGTHIGNWEEAIVAVGGNRHNQFELRDEHVECSCCGKASYQRIGQVSHQKAHMKHSHCQLEKRKHT